MDWVLRSPQIHSTFGNLGYSHSDGYHINDNCNAALEAILHSIITEDKYLRSYRRNISFGQNIKKDLIPLLIHAKEDKTVELLIKIFVNLTTPIECLFNIEDISKSDFGRHTLFEINNLLRSTKAALTDHRATKVIIEFLRKNSEFEQKVAYNPVEQCNNVTNSLLLLRNILHIPDDNNGFNPNYNGPTHSVQNQIMWNLFSQSIDKILIKLMSIPDAASWGVTMVQLIALLYKDQHVTKLHKLLNMWLETSLSESSEDNESNTSPPDRGSNDSSPMLTSDPTSDSSDTGGSGKCNEVSNLDNTEWETSRTNMAMASASQPGESNEIDDKEDYSQDIKLKSKKSEQGMVKDKASENFATPSSSKDKKAVVGENSDCGYGTQIETQESISTSSNEDELPVKKPVHQKPHATKQRINNKSRSNSTNTVQEKKRKKLVKRGKSNIINVQGLSHSTPTDDDISNILKEFTVDFLLKGFNSLVKTIHNQILTNHLLQIDTSHFFWLVTYFLKFATQIELDLEHVGSVLSFDIVSYLTAEGVNICEQFELAIKLDGNNLKPCIRRLHLVVTAIREFVQAIQVYKKAAHVGIEDQQILLNLQIKMCETEELRSLLVLLLRHYNPKYHSKQYLQDLVVTNHILLLFLDGSMKLPEYKGTCSMVDHVKQFASPEIMSQYGLLLEDYEGNGEFVNDCVFTVMHHVGGELGSLITLFQPQILKTFTSIWKSEFEICDDWSDLIEYVINTFVKKPHTLHNLPQLRLEPENFDEDQILKQTAIPSADHYQQDNKPTKRKSVSSKTSSKQRWTDEEISSLSWNYMQCNKSTDFIGDIVKMFKEDGIYKSRKSIIRELLNQFLINNGEFDRFMKIEMERNCNVHLMKKEIRDTEISKLCDQLTQDGKSKFLIWVQSVILETCNVKILLKKKALDGSTASSSNKERLRKDFDEYVPEVKITDDPPVMSPVSYHALLLNNSIPLVPWNCEQASICKDLKFLQLLHKLGFDMPVDTGKVFIRIPHFWTPDFLYEVASKISPIDTSKLKFSQSDISESSILISNHQLNLDVPADLNQETNLNTSPENFYQVHKQKHLASVVNFTPMPGSSFNSTAEEPSSSNWLEMVQKSQEYKLNLNIHQRIISEDEEMSLIPKSEVLPDDVMAREAGTVLTDSVLAMSTIMDVKEVIPDYNTNPLESEDCNNSVCDTASVASDLTRMYVSDEEEKAEELRRAPRDPHEPAHLLYPPPF